MTIHSAFRRLAIAIPLLAPFTSAAIELPEIISDNAVLQQQTSAPLWGWSRPGDKVEIRTSWDNKSYTASADPQTGRWEVAVTTPGASYSPYYITFTDSEGTKRIDNLLVGEV